MTGKHQLFFLLTIICIVGCNTKQGEQNKPAAKNIKPKTEIYYQFSHPKAWLKQHPDATAQRNVMAVNRADMDHLKKMDSIIVPVNAGADIFSYLPFPVELPATAGIDKIIFFSYPAQAFAAYEKGVLVYTGPTSMGRKADITPVGLYYTNWKAETTTSTFDDEWELKWNFNIDNKAGIGWHQYELPGYPASHSCLRLLETDAKYLYGWADQWLLDHDSVVKKGTPVVVFGAYDFKAPKPWLQLVNAPHALDISDKMISEVLDMYKPQESKTTKR